MHSTIPNQALKYQLKQISASQRQLEQLQFHNRSAHPPQSGPACTSSTVRDKSRPPTANSRWPLL